MMAVQSNFIGRLDQIRLLEDWLRREGERRWILDVHGGGGMGKTALLHRYQRLCEQYGAPYNPPIDFYELAYHSPRRVMRDIARAYCTDGRYQECFGPFLDATAREPAVDSAEAAEKYLREAVRLFKAGLAQLAHEAAAARQVKTVLFFDTCEQAPRSLRAWLAQDLLCDLPNVIAVVAGRDPFNLPPKREDELYSCALEPFTLDEARHFFAASELATPLSERQVADLWSLAGGAPILLALTADWLAHDVSPDELSQISGDQFARSLVQRFANLGELTHAAILYMGHLFHRFNADIFCKTYANGQLDPATARETLEKLRSFQFIKYRPSGDYQLHDQARRLVCEHLLTDADGLALRLRLSRDVLARYYRERPRPDPVLQAEQLYHELFIDVYYAQYHALFPDEARDAQHGYHLFEEAFDAAINRNDKIEICDLLLSVVEHEDLEGYFDRPSTAIKRARLWLRDPARREEACDMLTRLVSEPTLLPIQRIEALLSLSRFAAPDLARTHQEQARREIQRLIEAQHAQRAQPARPDAGVAARKAPPVQRAHALQLLAYLETNLGLTCRRQGRWGEAIEHYQRALDALNDLPTNIQKRRQIAAAHNNLAFVYRQRGDLYKAEIFCRLSLAVREELGEIGQAAYSYHTLGEIYLDMGRHAEAKHYLLKSLAAFRQVGDMRNAGMVFVDLATLARWRAASDLADYYYYQAISLFNTWDVPEGIVDAMTERACELHRRGLEQVEVEDTTSALEHYQHAEAMLREALRRLSGSDRHYRQAYAQSKLCMVLQARARLSSDAAEKEQILAEVQSLACQVEEYAHSYHYALFTGYADLIQGQIAFERAGELRRQALAGEPGQAGEAAHYLETAFKHFARACAALAEFYQSPSETFRHAFDYVIDCLFQPDLAPADVDKACLTILYHFEREGKDRVAAAFLENCRRIRQARGGAADARG